MAEAGRAKVGGGEANPLGSWTPGLPLFGKLTYIGPQEKPTPTVIFHPPNPAAGYELFERHQSAKVNYTNDLTGNEQVIDLTPDEQTAVLQNLAGVDFNDRAPSPRWSFLVIQLTAKGEVAREWLMGDVACRRVVNAISAALAPTNQAGKLILNRVPVGK